MDQLLTDQPIPLQTGCSRHMLKGLVSDKPLNRNCLPQIGLREAAIRQLMGALGPVEFWERLHNLQ